MLQMEKLVIEELQEYLSGFSHEQIQEMADEFKSAGLANVSAMLTYYMTHHASHDLSLSAVNPSEVAHAITGVPHSNCKVPLL